MADGVKLKIISDGSIGGTRIETEDGKFIYGAVCIRWELDINDEFKRSKAIIEVFDVPIEAKVNNAQIVLREFPVLETREEVPPGELWAISDRGSQRYKITTEENDPKPS